LTGLSRPILDNAFRQAALARPGNEFELAFKNSPDALFVKRMDENEESGGRSMNDKPFQKAVIADFHLYSPEGRGGWSAHLARCDSACRRNFAAPGWGRGSGLKTLNRAGFLFVPALAYW
jgi:hypothetical protein